jgi:hypothetical protein
MSPKAVETTSVLVDSTWMVRRYVRLEEVLMDDDSYRFHLTVRDEGRPPFIDQWFSSEEKANNFLDKVRQNATSSL